MMVMRKRKRKRKWKWVWWKGWEGNVPLTPNKIESLRPRHTSSSASSASVSASSASPFLCLGSIKLTFCLDSVHSLYSIILFFYYSILSHSTLNKIQPSLTLPSLGKTKTKTFTPFNIFLIFHLSSLHKTIPLVF